MPIYNYECPKCGHIEEQYIGKTSERHNAICSNCGKKTKLMPSVTNFHLKGSGWYVTDYANKNKTNKKKTKPNE